MRKFKVVHLIENLNVGGIERLIYELATLMDKNKYDISVWCMNSAGRLAHRFEEEKIPVKVLSIQSFLNPLSFFKLVVEIIRTGPHVLHTHTYFTNTIGRAAGALTGVPVLITHVHSTYWDYTKRNLKIERVLSRFSAKIICCSRAVQDFVLKYEKIDPAKVAVVHNGLSFRAEPPDSGKFREARGIDNTDIVLCTVGSLKSHKGHDVLLNALKRIHQRYTNVHLWIVGDGPEEKKLQTLREQLGLEDKVQFFGFQENIVPFVTGCDIAVLPSVTREGLGNVLIEAMACGKPVVASRVGGTREVVADHETGFLVAPGDADRFAHRIEELVNDPQKRERFGRNGRARYQEKFRGERMADDIGSIYTDALERKGIFQK